MNLKLQSMRMAKGLTKREVAGYCKVSLSTINRYENNPAKLPLYLIISLSKLYEVPPSLLL